MDGALFETWKKLVEGAKIIKVELRHYESCPGGSQDILSSMKKKRIVKNIKPDSS